MHSLFSKASAAIFLMVSLNVSANSLNDQDNSQSQHQPAATHQGHLEHQLTTSDSGDNVGAEADKATNDQRMRTVTHPKTGHVTKRYVGQ